MAETHIETLAIAIIDGLIRSALDLGKQSEYEEAIEDVDVLLTTWAKERDDLCRDALEEAKVHLESADDDHPQTEYALKRVEEVLRALEGETTRMDSRRQPRSLDPRPCPGDTRDGGG